MKKSGFYSHKYKGIRIAEHSGGVMGFRSHFAVFPDYNTALILMFNNESINLCRILTGISDIIFEESLQKDEDGTVK